jgi:hypothetical protein
MRDRAAAAQFESMRLLAGGRGDNLIVLGVELLAMHVGDNYDIN